jgi:CHAT domain-containing protein
LAEALSAKRGNEQAVAQRPTALVVGGPFYSGAALRGASRRSAMMTYFNEPRATQKNEAFGDLPGARLEAKLVARKLRARPLINADATVRKIQKSGRVNIMHLATHGFFVPSWQDEDGFRSLDPAMGFEGFIAPQSAKDGVLSARLSNPLHRCGVALAGANAFLRTAKPTARFGTGLLLASDLLSLDLKQVDLVFLSACDTGLGVDRVGDGIIGLQQAILAAGARAFVTSIWSIPDAVSCVLVAQFYTHLVDGGATISAALREAQREVRKLSADDFNEWVRRAGRLERGAVAPIRTGEAEAAPFAHERWWGGFRAVGDVNRRLFA